MTLKKRIASEFLLRCSIVRIFFSWKITLVNTESIEKVAHAVKILWKTTNNQFPVTWLVIDRRFDKPKRQA